MIQGSEYNSSLNSHSRLFFGNQQVVRVSFHGHFLTARSMINFLSQDLCSDFPRDLAAATYLKHNHIEKQKVLLLHQRLQHFQHLTGILMSADKRNLAFTFREQ